MRKILLLLSVAFMLSINTDAYAQVSYQQGWENAGAGLAGWTNTGTGGTFSSFCLAGGYLFYQGAERDKNGY